MVEDELGQVLVPHALPAAGDGRVQRRGEERVLLARPVRQRRLRQLAHEEAAVRGRRRRMRARLVGRRAAGQVVAHRDVVPPELLVRSVHLVVRLRRLLERALQQRMLLLHRRGGGGSGGAGGISCGGGRRGRGRGGGRARLFGLLALLRLVPRVVFRRGRP